MNKLVQYFFFAVSGISYSGSEQLLGATEDQKHLGFKINIRFHRCRQYRNWNCEESNQLWPHGESVQ